MIKQKVTEVMDGLRWKAIKAREWAAAHRAEITVFGPPMITFTMEMIKVISRRHNISEERRLKDNYVYDRVNGHYYETSRKLKSSEWLQLDERKAEGESIGAILRDMEVLKK